MKLKYYLVGLPLIGLLAASCGNRNEVPADSEISEFEIHKKLLTADRSYRVVTDYGTVYLEMYTSVQWPEKFGGNDIKVLQDSVLNFAYSDTTSVSIHDAIRKYLDDTSFLEGVKEIVPVDTLPSDSMTYFSSVTGSVLDLDEGMVTYQLVSSSYLGGAHPMTATHPFTYDFAESRVLDNSNIFRPGTPTDSIVPVIREALARQLGVPVSRLKNEGVFADQLTYPGIPYISGNTLYFHYDPYEIGPYAMGSVDVAVYPYEIERFLQPSVVRLFDQGF
ncbi:DUF3298 and DUF4163 domain-containing protein [uncultured Duncaniella sp.]|uniref:DUF3298 and DUF4163 domain-containing protein n=1 Tax=uncultured Duncaniella sp. TaxID=2768039 RepID=UPI0025F226FE|nr:DUF3298 and DUF4163 domain-containing protein [uncultured Duncaniella sp.]